MSQRIRLGIVICLVLAGIFFTFWDYAKYRKTETAKYGQGPGDRQATWKIDKLYQNEIAGVRIKYPAEWTETTKIVTKNTFGEVVEFSGQGFPVKIKVVKAIGTLKDWEDKEIKALSQNERMFGERSYLVTERTKMTVINFQRFEGDNTFMVSRYLAIKSDRLYVLEFKTSLSDWQKDEANFKAMAGTLVLL